MNGQVALGCFVVLAMMAAACVSEPIGIPRMDAAGEGGKEDVSDGVNEPTAGAPSEVAASRASCEALAIVSLKCGRCHGSPPEHGAPFSLVTFDDLSEVDGRGVTRRERMAKAIERGAMPATFIELEPPVQELAADERDTLLTWLRTDEHDVGRCD